MQICITSLSLTQYNTNTYCNFHISTPAQLDFQCMSDMFFSIKLLLTQRVNVNDLVFLHKSWLTIRSFVILCHFYVFSCNIHMQYRVVSLFHWAFWLFLSLSLSRLILLNVIIFLRSWCTYIHSYIFKRTFKNYSMNTKRSLYLVMLL